MRPFLSEPDEPIGPHGIDVVAAADLTEKTFLREYWGRNRPCVIKGALAGWPACERWQRPGYLVERCGDPTVVVRHLPAIEDEPRNGETRGADGFPLEPRALSLLLLSEFLDRASKDPPDPLWLHASMVADDVAGRRYRDFSEIIERHILPRMREAFGEAGGRVEVRPFQALRRDFGRFSFLPARPAEPRGYPRWRVFFYRNSFTDFHGHPMDAHLMCQVLGSKNVALFPPSAFDEVRRVTREVRHTYLATREAFPRFAALAPARATVEAGDALHIPIFWMHAVRSPTRGLGATVAFTWACPASVYGDQHFAQARESWTKARQGRDRRLVAKLAAYRVWSAVYRMARRLTPSSEWEYRA